jgi:hypothetical protein
VRLFAARGMEILVAQSYSKNLGLYAERIGAINVVCSSADAAARCVEPISYNLLFLELNLNPTKYVHDKINITARSFWTYL